ncbi:MAG TPA: FG-GAP-like repeat-containing protein, partial [Thermoanaerobaculia bacterium]|nr:FG-GAP-like repeat-containing protein [Thermoanaerobaculia bacterium]
MNRSLQTLALALTFLFAAQAFATSFVVPDDAELVAKSPAVVIGRITGSHVRERDTTIDTIYQLRIERVIKGPFANGSLIDITSFGGILGGRFAIVDGAAQFTDGDRVLLFLTPFKGGWTPTDLVLGKFRFATTSTGAGVLVRDEDDIVGWDRDGKPHVERIRRDQDFLRFVEQRAAGRQAVEDYFVNASDVLSPRQQFAQGTSGLTQQVNAPFPPATYTNHFQGGGNAYPARWPNMGAGVNYYKNASQNASGLADGGVSVIQTALAAWNNECGSAINMIYAGTSNGVRNADDGFNVVLFNDPNGDVPGSWTGAGTVAITYGGGGGFHTFAGRTDWVSIVGEDVIFQDGFPGTHPVMPTAMTHELGHSIGWRHSNAHWVTANGTDQACQPSVEECTSTAIMNSVSSSSLGYNLQPWDINAAQSVYPGGTCGGGGGNPPPVGGRRRGDVNLDSVADVVWRHDNGTNYLWLMANGNVSQALALPTVAGSWKVVANGDFNNDGRSDLFWRDANGTNVVWLMNGATVT